MQKGKDKAYWSAHTNEGSLDASTALTLAQLMHLVQWPNRFLLMNLE